MHTSSVSYHRIVFTNINDYPSLQELVVVLDLQGTDHPDIFDLVQDEGYSLSVRDAIETCGEAYGLYDSEDQGFDVLLAALRDKATELAYVPHTRVFEDSYHNPAIETDINPDELYDLLVVMAGPYFTVDNITTQWSVFSNKNVAGGHSGGSRITTRDFSIPVVMGCDEMETIVNGLAKHTPEQVGDYYVNKFISPLVDEHAIKNDAFRKSVARALLRTAAMELDPSEVHDIVSTPVSDMIDLNTGPATQFTDLRGK